MDAQARNSVLSLWRGLAPERLCNLLDAVPDDGSGAMTSENQDDYVLPDEKRLAILHPADVVAAAKFVRFAADPVAANDRLFSIATRKGYAVPDSVGVGRVEFAWEDRPVAGKDGWVRLSGKIFQTGDYPDKRFSMTPAELSEAIGNFNKPVPFDLEHMPTVLDGHLGHLVSTRLDPNGRVAHGEAAVPQWLDKMLGPGKRKVSATFDRRSKKLVGISWVLNPRITDAELKAAFAANPPETPMPDDLTPAADPAAPAAPADPGGGGTLHGSDLFADICDKIDAALSDADGNTMYSKDYIDMLKEVKSICDKGKATADKAEGGGEGDNAAMSKDKKNDKATAGFDKDGKVKKGPGVYQPGKSDPNEDPRNPARGKSSGADMETAAKFAAEQEKNEKLRERVYFSEGREWANQVIRIERRALPSDFDGMVGSYVQAAKDDERDDTKVHFGKEQVTRVEALKRSYASRPQHYLTEEEVKTQQANAAAAAAGGNVGFNQGGGGNQGGMSPTRVADLLSRTQLGRAAQQRLQNGKT